MLLVKYIHINMDKNKRPKLYTLPDTLQAVQRPPPVRSTPRGLSGIECRPVQRVQRPGVCVGAWRGFPCYLCAAVVPGALGAGVSTGGVYRERRGWGGRHLA